MSVDSGFSVFFSLSDGLTVDTCTQDKLEATITAIVGIFVDATTQIKALAGTGCVVDVAVCAGLVADILIVSIISCGVCSLLI